MYMNTTTPAIYVGTYHKYNCGSLFGKWFDLTDFEDKSEFLEACHALHANEADPELMFQNWEGIPSKFASESSVDWDFIEAYKRAVDEGKDAAFIAWVEYAGDCDYDAFEDAYCGEAESEEDYAWTVAEDCDLLGGILESLRGYFDMSAYARDMFLGGLVFLDGHVFHG
ncbi:antirestriction protein ArdA [Enterobacter cloacae]|uniref:antirestriction protein ArdA n=1 Tax=Enterobacter cloacae TaxID=550 RepID=UPI002B20FB1A|nr:antirestriction protein ArdA [Enterobacter cloacae]MEA5217597.1 antirestriction protein ArdA [Enterobacter cloacae]